MSEEKHKESSPPLADASRSDATGHGIVGATVSGVVGLGVGVWCVILGLLLCSFAPLLWIPGAALILIGVLSPFLGAAAGAGLVTGSCPHCEARVEGSRKVGGVTCPACQKRLLIRDMKFILVGNGEGPPARKPEAAIRSATALNVEATAPPAWKPRSGKLSDGTVCHHEGETGNYCTRCWTPIKPGVEQ